MGINMDLIMSNKLDKLLREFEKSNNQTTKDVVNFAVQLKQFRDVGHVRIIILYLNENDWILKDNPIICIRLYHLFEIASEHMYLSNYNKLFDNITETVRTRLINHVIRNRSRFDLSNLNYLLNSDNINYAELINNLLDKKNLNILLLALNSNLDTMTDKSIFEKTYINLYKAAIHNVEISDIIMSKMPHYIKKKIIFGKFNILKKLKSIFIK